MVPPISKKAFWDVNFKQLDFEGSSLFIMMKVFNYGTWADQMALLRYHGSDRVKKEIINAAYLRQPVLSFLCVILGLQKNDFQCYKRMQSNPLPWN
jgi:hypothetical protein